jgi:hypothetical protein
MDPVAVTDLRAAAAAAAARGAPESAYVYLRRSLDEAPKATSGERFFWKPGRRRCCLMS